MRALPHAETLGPPKATGPPGTLIPQSRATTASSAKEPSRRRPDHNAPLYGDHHGFDDSDPARRDGKPRGGTVVLFRQRSDPRPRSGNTTGYAIAGADGGITSGTAEFRLDRWQSGGMRFLRFKRWLTEIKHQAGGFDLVVYEQVRRHAGVDASHPFGGWLAILTAWCDHHTIAYQGVPVGTIKRHVTGKGNADKAAVIAAIRARGFSRRRQRSRRHRHPDLGH